MREEIRELILGERKEKSVTDIPLFPVTFESPDNPVYLCLATLEGAGSSLIGIGLIRITLLT
jgi:hypothetical protein